MKRCFKCLVEKPVEEFYIRVACGVVRARRVMGAPLDWVGSPPHGEEWAMSKPTFGCSERGEGVSELRAQVRAWLYTMPRPGEGTAIEWLTALCDENARLEREYAQRENELLDLADRTEDERDVAHTALRQIIAHHENLNRVKGRPIDHSLTIRTAREGLAAPPAPETINDDGR